MNLKENNTITSGQAAFIACAMSFSAITRLSPSVVSDMVGNGGWFTGITSAILYIPIPFVIAGMYRRYGGFFETCEHVLGKICSKVYYVLLAMWCLYLASNNLRYFGARVTSSLYRGIDFKPFLIFTLAITGLILLLGLVVLARMNQIFVVVISALVILSFLLLLKSGNVDYIMPVKILDLDVASATLAVSGVLAYGVFIFFASDIISDKKNIKKHAGGVVLYSILTNIFSIVIVMAVLGRVIISKIQYPMLKALKLIVLFGSIKRVESLIISVWYLADFVVIVVFSFLVLHLLKKAFSLKSTIPLIPPLLIVLFYMSIILAVDSTQLAKFSIQVAVYANFAIGYLIPVSLYLLGFLRKRKTAA